jgi:hypothetical protein
MLLASAFLFIPVPDWSDVLDIKTFIKVGNGYTLHFYTAGGLVGFTLQECSSDKGQTVHTAYGEDGYTLHVLIDQSVSGYTQHLHTASGRKGYTRHIYTASGGEGYTMHFHTGYSGKECISRLHSWCWKGKHPHVHTVDCIQGYTLSSTLLTVKGDTPLQPHCWQWQGI